MMYSPKNNWIFALFGGRTPHEYEEVTYDEGNSQVNYS